MLDAVPRPGADPFDPAAICRGRGETGLPFDPDPLGLSELEPPPEPTAGRGTAPRGRLTGRVTVTLWTTGPREGPDELPAGPLPKKLILVVFSARRYDSRGLRVPWSAKTRTIANIS